MAKETVAKPGNLSVAFEQICNAIAIADAAGSTAVLETLIQQCFLLAPSDALAGPEDFCRTLEEFFGIDASAASVSRALKTLEDNNGLLRQGSRYVLPPVKQHELKEAVTRASELEGRVKERWQATIERTYQDLDLDLAWSGLQRFLANVFRRHGVYSVRLLSPDFENDRWHDASLQDLLKESTSTIEVASEEYRSAILSFLSADDLDKDRATYLAQLADTAFNYFSLALPPEVTRRFRDRLNGLVLFFDTNALYGLLDLDARRQPVIQQLIDAVQKNGLPFRLRFHEATLQELKDLIQAQSTALKKRKWPREISRAVVESGALHGIELRYHQQNLENQINVEDFLDPLDHPDALLKHLGLDIYRPGPPNERLFQRTEYEYQAFLDKLTGPARDKSLEAIHHDAIVLATAHQLAIEEHDSLKTAALLVTFDGTVYSFDRQLSRDLKLTPRAVFPEAFLQVLRPYLDTKRDYDEAFARTFAVAEFRSIQGNAEVAASRVASMLARYKDIPEELATRILSNRLFLASIKAEQNDEEVAALVDKVIVDEAKQVARENRELTDANARQRTELETLKSERAEADRNRLETERRASKAISGQDNLQRTLAEEQELSKRLRDENVELMEAAARKERELEDVSKTASEATEEARQTKASLDELRRSLDRKRSSDRIRGAILLFIAEVAALAITSALWPGLRNHAHYLGIVLLWITFAAGSSIWVSLEPDVRRRHRVFAITLFGAWLIGLAPVIGSTSSFNSAPRDHQSAGSPTTKTPPTP